MERYSESETECLATYIVEAKQNGKSVVDGIKQFIDETKSTRTVAALTFHWNTNVKNKSEYKHITSVIDGLLRTRKRNVQQNQQNHSQVKDKASIVRFIETPVEPTASTVIADDKIMMTQEQFTKFVSENVLIMSNNEASLYRENELLKSQLGDCREHSIQLISKAESLSIENERLKNEIEILNVKLNNAIEDRDAVMNVISKAREFTAKESVGLEKIAYKVGKSGVIERVDN